MDMDCNHMHIHRVSVPQLTLGLELVDQFKGRQSRKGWLLSSADHSLSRMAEDTELTVCVLEVEGD